MRIRERANPVSHNDADEEHIATRAWLLQNLVNFRNAIQPRLETVMSKLNGNDAAAPDHAPEMLQ